jgi:hypothetical protein
VRVVLATCVLLAIAPVARAAAAWTETPVRGSAVSPLYRLDLSFGADGVGVAGWSSGVGATFGDWTALIGSSGPGTAQRLEGLPADMDGEVLSTLALPTGELAVVWLSAPSRLLIGLPGAVPGTAIRLPAGRLDGVGVGSAGDLAVALGREGGHPALSVTVRRPDGRVGTTTVAWTDPPEAALAVNGRGDVLMAYDVTRALRHGRVRHRFVARIVPASGGLGPAHTLGRLTAARSAGASFPTIRPSLGDDGQAIVGWSLLTSKSKTDLAVASAPAGGRFGRMRIVDRVLGGTVFTAGGSLAAWTGRHQVLRLAEAPRTPRRISRAPAYAADLVAGPGGAAALLYLDRSSRLHAIIRRPDGAFGPAETVGGGRVAPGSPVVAAFNPQTGGLAAAWQRPFGPIIIALRT